MSQTDIEKYKNKGLRSAQNKKKNIDNTNTRVEPSMG